MRRDDRVAAGPATLLRAGGPVSWTVFAVLVGVSLVVLFTPASGVPFAPAGVDKIVHLVLFGSLGAAGSWAGGSWRVLVVLLVAYAAGSELLQGLPAVNRSVSAWDWLADTVGVVLGLSAARLFARRRTG